MTQWGGAQSATAAVDGGFETARKGGRGQTEAGGGQLHRPNSQAFSSSEQGTVTQCGDAQPAAAAAVEPASDLVRGW